jgi:hypothetical protein|tara:strand:+ start:1653 stop:1784 length:132 start_codon:yes stop_codon:yes gene_type:complete
MKSKPLKLSLSFFAGTLPLKAPLNTIATRHKKSFYSRRGEILD